MAKEKNRKTDRRTLYTRMVIKDALLSLLADKEYADVTIADLCREAEINRGTFYLHYSNLHEVLEELFDDALGKMNHVLVHWYKLAVCLSTNSSAGCPSVSFCVKTGSTSRCSFRIPCAVM